jgi:urease accessory protein
MSVRAARDGGETVTSGAVELQFARPQGDRTIIQRQFANYPFHICRSFNFEGDPQGMATVYLQSLAGGIYEHDRLCLAFELSQGAAAHVTTQASTIVHGMPEGSARQEVRIGLEPGSFLEYMPDPMILFPSARLASRVHIRFPPGTTAIVCDSFLAHDPQGEAGLFDRLTSEIRIDDESGNVLVLDRFAVSGAEYADLASSLAGPTPAYGTFMALDRDVRPQLLIAALGGVLDQTGAIFAGVSELPNGCGVWARLLCRDGAALRRTMDEVWMAARQSLRGKLPARRRK